MRANCNKIISVLKKELSISDIVAVSKLSRSLVRTMLARLEGAEKVSFRKIGNAKVYSLVENKIKKRGAKHEKRGKKPKEKPS